MQLTNAVLWAIAVAVVAAGYTFHGWRGALLAISGVVFLMLLQFSRAMAALRAAAQAPKGVVPSTVMLNARLARGQKMFDLMRLAGAFGERIAEDPETYRWRDPGGSVLEVRLVGGRVSDWELRRPAEGEGPGPAA